MFVTITIVLAALRKVNPFAITVEWKKRRRNRWEQSTRLVYCRREADWGGRRANGGGRYDPKRKESAC